MNEKPTSKEEQLQLIQEMNGSMSEFLASGSTVKSIRETRNKTKIFED